MHRFFVPCAFGLSALLLGRPLHDSRRIIIALRWHLFVRTRRHWHHSPHCTCKYLRVNCIQPNNSATSFVCKSFWLSNASWVDAMPKMMATENIHKIPNFRRKQVTVGETRTDRLRCSKLCDSIKLMACKMIRVNGYKMVYAIAGVPRDSVIYTTLLKKAYTRIRQRRTTSAPNELKWTM